MQAFATIGATSGRPVRRLEMLTGPERRRSYKDTDKMRRVAETLKPGACVAALARRHGLHPQQLYSERQEPHRGGEGPVALLDVAPDGSQLVIGEHAIAPRLARGPWAPARSAPRATPAPDAPLPLSSRLNSGAAKAQTAVAGRRPVPAPVRRAHTTRAAVPGPAANDPLGAACF